MSTPLFGILLTLIAFECGVAIHKKFSHTLVNPLLIANVLIRPSAIMSLWRL